VGVAAKHCRRFQPGFVLGPTSLIETDLFFQIAWVSIGLASWRFRKAWVKQGRPLDELKFRASWTWPWGPPFVVSLSRIHHSYLNGIIQGGIRFYHYLKYPDFPSCFHGFSDSMVLQYKDGLPSTQCSRGLILSPSISRSRL